MNFSQLCSINYSNNQQKRFFEHLLEQGFSKGVPRNFWTVPREKVLGKCEHIKKGLCIKYLSSVTY
jgi:hypothetical protein